MTIFVTGIAGFIGSNFALNWINESDEEIIGIDKLTYAGNIENLSKIEGNKRFKFFKGDICDSLQVSKLFDKYKPRVVIHFAAESHVDRSISGPDEFIQTNIVGTFNLLKCSNKFFTTLDGNEKENFRFLHVSTDEVYGTLTSTELPFSEEHPYKPNSPYSASKASSDHLVRSWNHTYGLPTLTTNCSNNYGPFQFPEKLIPLCILNALEGKELPLYGDGLQIRDWLYVGDHCDGIKKVIEKGIIGQTYNIGGENEMTNLQIVNILCEILDKLKPRNDKNSYKSQISFIKDRPGHDRRYAINSKKITNTLNWRPKESFLSGIQKTVEWYLSNEQWISNVKLKSQ
jgi:dTDP-glucose 4,6-dehydratase